MLKTNSILDVVGNTPLVKLNKFLKPARFDLYAKLELLNPGGSIKDRTATKMLLEALKQGQINQQTTIIESSSGNLAIGLAQACAYLNLKLICVMDINSTLTNRRLVEIYGATIDLVIEADPYSGGFLQARVNRVNQLLDLVSNSFNCNQYANVNNPKAHHQTMAEIANELSNKVDYLFVATSTCGTLRGCAEYIAQEGLNTKIIAVDAQGSVIFGDKPKKRLIPGHGAGIVPELFQPNLSSSHILVSDLDCILGCYQLLEREAIFAGGSSGAIASAILRYEEVIPSGSTYTF
ncbi:MAG: 2,3-diaminopropionate biosynthesis protein SbnA [Symploca sp. SIO2C1]|nr:2,3-diaminopropionate biosynthesis protein SbnA [Symploca sp. SIO2C1]